MAKPLLTPERRAELLRRYPHESNTTLADAFGLKPAQVAHIGFEASVRKSRATLSAVNTKSRNGPSALQQALAVVKAAGRAGMSRAEVVAALPGLDVAKAVDSLAVRGHLHAAGRRGATRWFEHAADAAAHAAACGLPEPRLSHSRRALASRRRFPAGSPTPQPQAHAAPVLPPVQEGPPVLGRTYELTEASSRLFSTLGPGQYADDTPRSWVAAITRRA